MSACVPSFCLIVAPPHQKPLAIIMQSPRSPSAMLAYVAPFFQWTRREEFIHWIGIREREEPEDFPNGEKLWGL